MTLVPVIILVVAAVYVKVGEFDVAITRDTRLSPILSPYYILNSIEIFGPVFLLVPVAFNSEEHTSTITTIYSLRGSLLHSYFGVQLLKTNKHDSWVSLCLQHITLLYLQLRISGEATYSPLKLSRIGRGPPCSNKFPADAMVLARCTISYPFSLYYEQGYVIVMVWTLISQLIYYGLQKMVLLLAMKLIWLKQASIVDGRKYKGYGSSKGQHMVMSHWIPRVGRF